MTLSVDVSPAVEPAPFADLARFGDRLAVATAGTELTYVELAELVATRALQLGEERSLVLLAAENQLDSLITYLAALSSGHPLIVVPADQERGLDALTSAFGPDVICTPSGDVRPARQYDAAAHHPHPELALLLSTSGSTGSPKLVRLSRGNVSSNAESIATYLGVTDRDRAITSLPLHYCYGLSVVNSHLMSGAGLILTDLSVVDPGFWELARQHGATSFAGVPYTFELLDQAGFDLAELPRLRYVTQAGGRMPADRVRRFAELGQRQGWDFYVMYGQTEATARMAYLPPDQAAVHPECIGVPVPGGSIRLEPTSAASEPGVGELVYTGPNVMMGYARSSSDLALGCSVRELRTGDLARQHPAGLFEIVGRTSRFAKLFGTRISLDHVESTLRASGLDGWCVSDDDLLWVFTRQRRQRQRIRRTSAALCGVPERAVRVQIVDTLPTTPNGKPDYAALQRHIQLAASAGPELGAPPKKPATADQLRDVYAHVLGRPEATVESTFTSLGGDSLSYVELSIRLGDLVDDVPRDWPARSVRELAHPAVRERTRPRWGATIEMSVLLRAVAIVLIVVSHTDWFVWYGGAHILLGVAGYNYARFSLSSASRLDRLRGTASSVARIVVPSVAWIALVAAVNGGYETKTALLLNAPLGSETWNDQWQFWFLEALVWTLLTAAACLALPWVERIERRQPFGFALVILGGGLAWRYATIGVEAGPTERYMPTLVFWCFALGWAACRARTARQRLLVSAVVVLSVYGFFADAQREATVIVGLLLLLWVPAVRAPALVNTGLGVLASSSLYVYLTHWQVYPHLEVDHPLLAVLASFAVGIAYWQLVHHGRRGLARAWADGRRKVPLMR